MEDNLPKLPKGWAWETIGEIAKKINPGFPTGRHNKEKRGIPHLRPMNISTRGEIDLSDIKYVEEKEYDPLMKGDVLFNNTNSPELLGKTSYVRQDTNWAYSNHMTRIRVDRDFLNPAWIAYGLHKFYLDGFFKMNCIHHVNQASINTGFLSDKVIIPIPPLPEQHRIVTKIEELFTKLDAGVEALNKVKAQLKRYRQAVLKYAFEGKLTQEWREANKDKLEPASALLERIKEKRKKKAEGKFKELPPLDTSDLPELPEGWAWERLGELSDATGGYAFKSSHFAEKGKYQVIKIGNVKMGLLRLDEKPAFINDGYSQIINKYGLRYGDLVITLTGTRKKRDYGFVAMIKRETNLLLNQRLAVIRFYKPLYSEYFQYALRGEHFQNNFFLHETGNVGQGNVGMDAIVTETISIPPLLEQQKIVDEIESRLSMADEVEKIAEQTLTQSDRLRQSILKSAFEGKLVPQDPTDEPAEKLLERIKADKARKELETKSRGKKSKQMELK
jgi:type I restriction enzyme S subunit